MMMTLDPWEVGRIEGGTCGEALEWCPEQGGHSIDTRDYGAMSCIKSPADDFCFFPPVLWPSLKLHLSEPQGLHL